LRNRRLRQRLSPFPLAGFEVTTYGRFSVTAEDVLPMRGDLQVLHVGFQGFGLNPGQAEHSAVVVDQLSDEGGGAAQALRLLFDGGGLLRREPERLRKVVVSSRRPRHFDAPS